jgi:hypothetical protein
MLVLDGLLACMGPIFGRSDDEKSNGARTSPSLGKRFAHLVSVKVPSNIRGGTIFTDQLIVVASRPRFLAQMTYTSDGTFRAVFRLPHWNLC